MALLAGIEIGIVSALVGILVSHVHGRGHGIPVALVHESRISTRSTHVHAVHARTTVVLLAGVAAVGIGSPHSGVALLLLLGIVVPPAGGHCLGSRHLTLVRGRRLGGSRALAIWRTHFKLSMRISLKEANE